MYPFFLLQKKYICVKFNSNIARVLGITVSSVVALIKALTKTCRPQINLPLLMKGN